MSGTPIVIFAVASLAGSRLVARIGVIAAVTAGLLLAALGSATRSLAFSTVSLFAATVAMGMGVAVAQPAMPALVGRWLPKRLVLGTSVYTNGLLVGEILPVALPLLFPAFADYWRATFALWAAPIVAIAVLTFVLAPREGTAAVRQVSGRWWPDWQAWDVLAAWSDLRRCRAALFRHQRVLARISQRGWQGRSHQPRFDGAQPRSTAGLVPVDSVFPSHRKPGVAFHSFKLGRTCGRRRWIVVTASALTVVSAAMVGFAAGTAFALGLTLPPLLSKPEEVARVAAAMFTISYASTVVVSLICGALWDVTATARAAFLPIIIASLMPIVLVPTIKFPPSNARAGSGAHAARSKTP